MEVLIHRVSNYPNLLLTMPRYCSPIEMLAKTAKQRKVPQIVFLKDTTKWH